VEIDILADVFLPLALDEVEEWRAPSTVIVMFVAGVVTSSPRDMAKAWPEVWGNERAAKRALAGAGLRESTEGQTPIKKIAESLYRPMSLCAPSTAHGSSYRAIRYQHLGERQKWRCGWYNPALVADPQRWLEERLGCKVRIADAA
jgi:hypothetical protein